LAAAQGAVAARTWTTKFRSKDGKAAGADLAAFILYRG
jgi:hypothetical protein